MLLECNTLSFIEKHRFHTMGPCNIFYKSNAGKYICSDERTAFIAGVETRHQMFNKMDSELEWSCYSEKYLQSDQSAMIQNETIVNIEECITINHKHVPTLTLKQPVLDNNGDLQGVFGAVLYVEEYRFLELTHVLNFIQTSLGTYQTGIANQFMPTSAKEQLTAREKDCAHYLCLGLSAREIAMRLHLSKRTVESHLANMKDKLRVRSKSELIMTLLDCNIIL